MLHRSFVKKCLCLAKSSKKLPWREIQDTEKSAREIFINAFLNAKDQKINFLIHTFTKITQEAGELLRLLS